MLYAQSGDRIIAIDSMTSLDPRQTAGGHDRSNYLRR